jgi:hypothetical protein
MEEVDDLPKPVWAVNSSHSSDCLEMVMPSDEAILEAMTGLERPWDDFHHRSYFLPKIDRIERGEFHVHMNDYVDKTMNPLVKHGVYAEGNMENILETIPINISNDPNVIENVFIGAEC